MWYWIFTGVFYVIFKCFFSLTVEGLENIPQKSNFIIISNHNSYLDPAVFMAAVRKRIYCIAMQEIYLFTWLKWFLFAMKTIPRGHATQKALDLLMQNKNIGLYPEGGIGRDGQLKEFRSGAVLLAYKTGRPVVPCAIFGTSEALPPGAIIPRLRKLKIRIGKPVFFQKKFDEINDDIELQEGLFKLRNIIKGMLNAG
ncbi:MAG: lysophospholipid acyltransferase family protein [Elusimicrobiota bacterium]|jgi:1-acyl-sn-glycerol-3-phosphate acyltransferase